MKISAVVFDAYGTLFDTANGSVRATRYILRKCGSTLDATEVYARWKTYHKEIIAELTCFQMEQAVFAEGLARVYRYYGIYGNPYEDVKLMTDTLGIRKVFDDALPCLQWCRERFHIAIASNTDTKPFTEDLRRNGLEVDEWYTSELLEAYKPHHEFYDRMLKHLRREPKEVVYVGDTIEADVIGPQASGMNAIWINRKKSDHACIGNLVEITGLDEIPTTLSALQSYGEPDAARN